MIFDSSNGALARERSVISRALCLSLALGTSAMSLISCRDGTNPTGPGQLGDQPPLGPDFAWASNSWAVRAPMPTGRAGLGVGVVTNASGQSILYAIGGDVGGQSSTVVQAYNYTTNSWTTKARMPAQLKRPAGVAVIAGKIYFAGGVQEAAGDGLKLFPYLFAYSPATNTWSRKADMPKANYEGIGGAINGKLYVVAGTTLSRYDPATNRWQTGLPPAPHSHRAGAGGVINGKLYAAGGYGAEGLPLDNLDVYDPATNKWTTKAHMPAARYYTAGTVLGGKLYILGGQSNQQVFAMVTAYDPGTNTWSTKAPMSVRREMLAAGTITAFGNSKIVALGGLEWIPVNEAYKP
jgi:N-acetylneuraminic acid mutarotase